MLIFQPNSIPHVNKEGESVLISARKAGVFCENICGGKGTCGKCRVKVEIGEFNPVTTEEKKILTLEELKAGYRLACCLYPKFWFKTCEVLMANATEEQHKFIYEIEGDGIDFFRKKSKEIGWNYGNWDMNRFGIAIDIGTTNIEVLFWNLDKGECVARVLQPNPQQKYGADVVSRIAYAMESKEHFEELCEVLRDEVKNMIDIFLKEMENSKRECILEKVVIEGNAAMMHFFEKENVLGFAKAPYQSSYREGRRKDGDILTLNETKILLLPNIESFVGADTVGVLLYLDKMYQVKSIDNNNLNILIIDIGTNGELILQAKGKCFVSSTSAGPAFEGATMLYGMRAESGAITGVEFKEGRFNLKVIGEVRPKGICGSGFIEIIAKLYEIGLIEKTGYLLTKEEAKAKGISEYLVKQLRESEYGTVFELYSDNQGKVLLTQKDIRELQLAKGAIVAGVNTMLAKCNLKPEDVDKCYLAGAFGTYLDGRCAKLIGLLPDIPTENIIPIGNGALLGASCVLMEEGEFELACKMATEAKHISLSEETEFREEYIKGMNFSENIIDN
ncbi:MAG: DUF4445 domain-containing protein [Lachnospiraceae bacterium]|nr:DUF4445 domain-containing protein [Lachnospiraceae bacterium]